MLRIALLIVAATAGSAAAKDTVTPSGALDFQLVDHGADSVTLRDAAWEITFPGAVQIKESIQVAPGGAKLKAATAQVVTATEGYIFFVLLIPTKMTYDATAGETGARDQGLANVAGKVISEARETIGGLSMRHVTASATVQGMPLQIQMYVGWDAKHHTLVSFWTMSSGPPSAKALAFLASFKDRAAAAAPPAGDGT